MEDAQRTPAHSAQSGDSTATETGANAGTGTGQTQKDVPNPQTEDASDFTAPSQASPTMDLTVKDGPQDQQTTPQDSEKSAQAPSEASPRGGGKTKKESSTDCTGLEPQVLNLTQARDIFTTLEVPVPSDLANASSCKDQDGNGRQDCDRH